MEHQQASSSLETIRQGDLICNRFKVISEIGSGSHGSIYHVTDGSRLHYAAKVTNGSRLSMIAHHKEVEVLTSLQRSSQAPEGFPNAHFIGQHHNLGVLCMSLLGENLFRITLKRNWGAHAVFRFGREMLDRLETLHRHGFVHLDVKLQNFVIDGEGAVHLIDFGMARRYRDLKTGSHLPQRKEKAYSGTAIYASMNTHKLITPSRRDDLESLGYSIIEMFNSGLPWEDEKTFEEVGISKATISLSKLCEGLPQVVYEYMVRVTAMSYYDTPNYSGLRQLLKSN